MGERSDKKTFLLELAPDLKRELPIITLADTDHKIASFVMLGDVELNEKCGRLVARSLTDQGLLEKFDIIVAIEAKGIVLAHETAKVLGQPFVVVIRKSVKKYMYDPLQVPVESITSQAGQTLVLDGRDADRVRGKRVCLVEDVIATGGSVIAAEQLLRQAGAEITVISCVLLKGAMERPPPDLPSKTAHVNRCVDIGPA